jgi:hypothetical protein
MIGDLLQWTLGIFDVIGNYFNFFLLMFGFFGFIYWMNLQRSYNKAAENDSNQLK